MTGQYAIQDGQQVFLDRYLVDTQRVFLERYSTDVKSIQVPEAYWWGNAAIISLFARKFNDTHEADGRFGSGDSSTGASSLVKGLHSKPGWDEALTMAHDRFAAGFEGYNGYTKASYLEEEKAHIDGLFKNAGVWLRTSSANLTQILTDGRVKSVFETKTTGADEQNIRSYLSGRKDVEQILFGYPKNLAANQRPIYGYVTNNANGGGASGVDQYGSVAIHFSDTVRANTTVTMADSADTSGALQDNPRMTPVPINAPDYRGFVGGISPLSQNLGTFGYTEAQIHGGAATRANISEVVFRDRAPSEAQIALMEQYHIPYRHTGGGS